MNHPADIRHFAQVDADTRYEDAVAAARTEIFDALLTTGHDDVDDERLVINIDAAELRKAHALYKTGARDAALVAFVALTEAAADKAAEEEADDIVSARMAEHDQCAAEDRWDAQREDRRLA